MVNQVSGAVRPNALRLEMPTVAVAVAVNGGLLLLTWYFWMLPLWIAAALGSLLITWHGSFQHETIHGHPTPSRRLNAWLGGMPFALWIPYERYRQTHLWHHRYGGRYLTDPAQDPESFYLRPGSLASFGFARKLIYRVNCTLAGRVLFGPLLTLSAFFASEVRRIRLGDRRVLGIWIRHAVGVAAMLVWVIRVCHIPLLVYIGLIVYPGISLTHLRSFAEHRADEDPTLRTAVVETHPLLSLLFLNNNLHIAHHVLPKLPWYALPEAWRRMQDSALGARSEAVGLVFRGGYSEVIRRYLFRPAINVEHPVPPAGSE